MDIHQLRIFASVFRNRSFTAASEELRLTQPTISDHIKALEDDFSCKLFNRLGRKIEPTREAEVLYGHALEIIEKADNIKDILSKFRQEVSGELVIGASSIPGTYLISPIIASFRRQYPSVSFQVLISDSKAITEKVSKHEILMGISGSKSHDDQINYVPFMEDELVVVSSPALVKDDVIAIEDLARYPIVLREEGSGTRRETEKILESRGVSFDGMQVACILGSTDAVKQAVKSGIGISILSRLSINDELTHNTLKEISIKDFRMKRNFYIITHKKRSLPHAYNIFLKFLKEYQMIANS